MNVLTLIEQFQRRRLGGTGDAAATTIGAAGLLLGSSLPARLVSPWLCGAAGAAALGYLTRQFLAPAIEDAALDSSVPVVSDDPQGAEAIDGGGLFIGHCKDSGQPLHINRDELTRHIFVLGATGVGKTVFAQGLMQQQIARGGGMLWVDAKLDSDNPKALLAAAMCCGRENDIVIINPGDPSQSLTYNPILRGDPDEIASRILTLVPTSEHASPGADHYRQEALQGLTTMVSALQRAGLAFNMLDLSVLLMSVAAMESLHSRLTSDPRTRESEEARNFALFLDKFRHLNRMTNKLEINISKVKETFGGIGGRMYQFGTGKFGQVMNTYNPDVELYDAICANKIIYIALPTMGKNDVALNFAKMLLGDLRTAISWVQALPEPQRPDPPFLCVLDEMGGYATQALARPIEQSRSARIVLCSMVQSLANLDAVSKEFRQIILGNSWTKVYFKIGEHDSAYAAAETIGTEMQVLRSLSDSSSASNSTSFLRATPESTTAQGSGYATGEREAEGHRVTPDDLKALEKGDAIVTVGGSLVYNVRMSLPLALKRAMEHCGPVEVMRPKERDRADARGANFGRDSNRFLRDTSRQEAVNRG
jgi:intracellular multiplication protein IcmO